MKHINLDNIHVQFPFDNTPIIRRFIHNFEFSFNKLVNEMKWQTIINNLDGNTKFPEMNERFFRSLPLITVRIHFDNNFIEV